MAAPIVHLEFKSFDFARTSAFYAKVFDWRTEHNASSTYMKLDAEDGPTAGWVRADMSQAPGPLAYIVVDDLATTLAEVEGAGGRVLVPKMPFAGGGEIALFADPDGNVVGLWTRKGGAAPPAAGKTATKPAASVAAAPAKASAGKAPEAKPEAKSDGKADKKAKPAKKK
jgi:predicted enzyme related to lactoylglutathione lyase